MTFSWETCISPIMQFDPQKNPEMSSQLSVTLSSESQAWKAIFELQNSGDYASALAKLADIAPSNTEVGLYAEVLELNLRVCLHALKGAYPDQTEADTLRSIMQRSLDVGAPGVAIEAALLLFDCFSNYMDEALVRLSDYESHMDNTSRRRWIHRKGLSLVQAGNLQGAADLWAGEIGSRNDLIADQDDSLCALLLDYGRVSSQLGKYSDAVELYNQAVCVSRTPINQGASLIRLSNALERISRPAQADKRRIEYFNLIGKEYPTRCALCSMSFGKEPKFLIPCCKTISHSECLRTIVSEHQEDETDCPFCNTHFYISDIEDPSTVSARKYQRHKKSNNQPETVRDSMELENIQHSE